MREDITKQTLGPNYDEVIFYRRFWIFALLLFFMTPVALIIGLTGDVYRHQEGQAVAMPKAQRLMFSIGYSLLVLFKLLAPIFIHPRG